VKKVSRGGIDAMKGALEGLQRYLLKQTAIKRQKWLEGSIFFEKRKATCWEVSG
jgi:hypothetical protein